MPFLCPQRHGSNKDAEAELCGWRHPFLHGSMACIIKPYMSADVMSFHAQPLPCMLSFLILLTHAYSTTFQCHERRIHNRHSSNDGTQQPWTAGYAR